MALGLYEQGRVEHSLAVEVEAWLTSRRACWQCEQVYWHYEWGWSELESLLCCGASTVVVQVA